MKAMAYVERQQHMNADTGRVLGGGERVGAFGVESIHEVNGGGPNMGPSMTGTLPDSERGIGEPVHRGKGLMPAQRQPDHGPHHHHDGHRRRRD